MKIIQVHNEYQHFGGEEVVVAAEKEMLSQYGHDVEQWIVKNSSIKSLNLINKAKVAVQSVWSWDSYGEMSKRIEDFKPDVVHVHNTIPLITPSVYAACQSLGVPVVQTLHNYKLICPGVFLYRDGNVCEDCVKKFVKYPAVVHGCYRNNRTQSAIAVSTLTVNQLRKTYQNDVDIYIALSRFARKKFIAGGLPPEKIAVKPNFFTSAINLGNHQGEYVLFVGKLVPYKGLETIINAWELLDQPIPLKIVGQGPLEILLKSNLPVGMEYLGVLPREQVIELMQNAKLLVFASEWYEPFGMVLIEAFATGLPVVASSIGGVPEIVKNGVSGWHFTPGDAQDLAHTLQQAWHNPTEIARRGSLARQEYEQLYSLEKNYEMTMNIYNTAIQWRKENRVSTVF